MFTLLVLNIKIIKKHLKFLNVKDCDLIPFSECCNEPIFLKINDNYIVNFMCSSKICQHPVLLEMVIGKNYNLYEDQYEQIQKDQKLMGKMISKFIISGKFKSFNMNKEMIKFRGKIQEDSNFPFVINRDRKKLNTLNRELENFDKKLELLSPIKVTNRRPDSKGRPLKNYHFKVGHKHIDPIRKYKNILDNISLEQSK